MLRLSKHFVKNWQVRVGGDPDELEVRDIIQEAVRIQKGRKAYGRTTLIKTLSIYWHQVLGLIITVDHFTGTVVSVYSGANMPAKFRIGETMGC